MNRLSIDDMQALARVYDGKCLSEEYKDSHTKLIWQCSLGHQWEATPTNIKQGKWCPHCAGKQKTIEDMATLAQRHGGFCLSPVYRTARSKLRWQCRNGHIWEARKKAAGSALDTGQLTNEGTGIWNQHLKNIFSSLGEIWWKRWPLTNCSAWE